MHAVCPFERKRTHFCPLVVVITICENEKDEHFRADFVYREMDTIPLMTCVLAVEINLIFRKTNACVISIELS